MNLTQAIHRNSVFYFVALIGFVTQAAILAPLFSPAYAAWWKGVAGWYMALPLP